MEKVGTPRGTGKKILIVEDDQSFFWILKQVFDREGFFVVSAQDGQEGLDMAIEEKPDLILLDISLPRMDGITMAKSLKEKGEKSQIIFLTNFSDAEHIGKAIEIVGETDYIVKADLHVEQIVSVVKTRLGIK